MQQDYTENGVDASTAATTELGPVNIHRFGGSVRAKLLTVEQRDAADAGFNANLDGNAVFASSQAVSASNTLETFVPDQNRYASGANVSAEFEVTSAGTSQFNVGLLLETEDSQ